MKDKTSENYSVSSNINIEKKGHNIISNFHVNKIDFANNQLQKIKQENGNSNRRENRTNKIIDSTSLSNNMTNKINNFAKVKLLSKNIINIDNNNKLKILPYKSTTESNYPIENISKNFENPNPYKEKYNYNEKNKIKQFNIIPNINTNPCVNEISKIKHSTENKIINQNNLFEKILSKYIILNIFEFLDDKLKLQIFQHSKEYQKKFNLNLFDYQKKCIEVQGINLNDYLYDSHGKKLSDFSEGCLRQKLKNSLKLKNFNMEKYLITYYDNYYKNKNNYDNPIIYIDIYSPFFPILSKTKYFWELFAISINTEFMHLNRLEAYYKYFFIDILKSNIKYSLICDLRNIEDFQYLARFNVNFEQVKRLIINHLYQENSIYILDRERFFNTIFSFKGIENNLVHLKLNLKAKELEANFEKLNNFKVLEYLELEGLIFKPAFTLKLFNIKKILLISCENISIPKASFLNLNQLYIKNCKLENIGPLLEAPNLEKLEFYSNKIGNINLNNIIPLFDFSNIKKLKVFSGDINDFLNLEICNFEKLSIMSNKDSDLQTEKKAIEKILLINSLKELKIKLNYLDDNIISQIYGENYSIKKIEINWEENQSDCVINNLLNKLPNINDLDIYSLRNYSNKNKTNLEIKENSNCKIDTIKLYGDRDIIKFYCTSYDKLHKIDITLKDYIIDIKNLFPLFNDKCNIIFNSLVDFKFNSECFSYKVSLEVLNNICNNLDNMPNLKIFELNCYSDEINKNYHYQLDKKIMSMNLDIIRIEIIKNLFARVERNQTFGQRSFFNAKGITIYKNKNDTIIINSRKD